MKFAGLGGKYCNVCIKDRASIPRTLDLHSILARRSCFLFGPRQTGKSWLIRHQFAGCKGCEAEKACTHVRIRQWNAPGDLATAPPAGFPHTSAREAGIRFFVSSVPASISTAGQLQEAGNATTPAHYLTLLESAFLLSGLEKFKRGSIRKRGSCPKLIAWNNALVTSLAGAAGSKKHGQTPGGEDVLWKTP